MTTYGPGLGPLFAFSDDLFSYLSISHRISMNILTECAISHHWPGERPSANLTPLTILTVDVVLCLWLSPLPEYLRSRAGNHCGE